MTSAASAFEHRDRGWGKALVLIPGWASDCRIFSALNLAYNYIFPRRCLPDCFASDLSDFLKGSGVDRVSLLGWSLGGFLAADFAGKFPDAVEELILISVRRKYDPETLRTVRIQVQKNAPAFLYKFYMDWFSPCDQAARTWFRASLMKAYMQDLRIDELVSGLEFLDSAAVHEDSLKPLKKISIFHGRQDRIAPFDQALALHELVPQSRLVLMPDAGHVPFLTPAFKDLFIHG